MELEEAVKQAQAGDKEALELIVEKIQNKIYALALRMLWHPEEARDATQEILIRIITRLSGFRGESAFTTWVYRVAANYLKTVRKSRLEKQGYNFARFGEELSEGLTDASIAVKDGPDDWILLDEIRTGCTLGMLLCLDREHRLAYIIGEILEFNGTEGAAVLDIKPAAFRQRLSRARRRILDFMRQKCGLVDAQNACRCDRRLSRAIELKRVDPENLLFVSPHETEKKHFRLLQEIEKLDETRKVVAIYRAQNASGAPDLVSFLRRLITERESEAVE